jgi:hypothetical protein
VREGRRAGGVRDGGQGETARSWDLVYVYAIGSFAQTLRIRMISSETCQLTGAMTI